MASVGTNSLAMLAARLLVPFFSFGINVAVARLLGSHVLGQYVELVALLLVAQALAGGGLSILVTRDVAAHPEDSPDLLRRARRLGVVSGVVATLLFLLYVRVVLPTEPQAPAVILAAAILPSAWISAQEGLFMGLHLHSRITLVALVEGGVRVVASALVLLAGGGLAGLCAGLTLGRVMALCLGERLARRAGAGQPFRRPSGPLLELARAFVPFTAIVTLSILYFRQDVIVVGAMRSKSETGIYGVAATLYALALLVPNSLMAALYPRLSAAFARSRDEFHEVSMLTTKLLTVCGVVMALGLIAVAPWIVRLLYGANYLDAIPVLSLLAAALPLHGANAALGQATQAAHLQNDLVWLTVCAVVVNLILNLTLIPLFGIEGAACALLASATLSTLILGWIYHRGVSPVALRARALLVPLAVAAPILLPLASPGNLRIPAAALGLVVLLLGARLSGLADAGDLARMGSIFALGGRRLGKAGA
jgi:O-antigen/teichoic acid export membrane protein